MTNMTRVDNWRSIERFQVIGATEHGPCRVGEKLSAEVERWRVQEPRGKMHDDYVTVATQGTDAQWQRRNQKRLVEFERLKATNEYRIMISRVEASELPNAPDPNDSNISKREWEKQTMRWRHEMNRLSKKKRTDHTSMQCL